MYPVSIIRLAGDEPQMGRQHGEITRALGDYEDTLAFYPSLPDVILGAGHRSRTRRVLLEVMKPLMARGLARLERARPEALLARSRAFMEALGQPAREAQNVLVMDLIQNTIGSLFRLGLASDAGRLAASFPGACSSFAVWSESSEDGRLIHGRNFDLPGIGVWEKRPTVVFCSPRVGLRYGFVTTRGADAPGITGFNEAGLSICAHTRFHRNVSFEGRGVVDLSHLVLQRASTIAEALQVATEAKVASCWGLFLSSARERQAIAIEVHAGRVAVVSPPTRQTFHTCTNRMQSPVMQPGEIAPSDAWVRYSDGRLAVLERSLARDRGLRPTDAMALLGSREAGDVPGWERSTGDTLCQSITIQSVVIDAEQQRLWLGAGPAPASLGPWVEVPWQWGEPGSTIVAPAAREIDKMTVRPGFEHFMEAARLEGLHRSHEEVERALTQAVAAAPEDPSYQHLAAGCALRAGRIAQAREHLEAALAHERSPFRQHELTAWIGRTKRPNARRAWRDLSVDFQLLTVSN